MTSAWLGWGALCCAASVIAGAFGAHGLESRLDSDALELWETGARYLMFAGLGLMVMGVRSASSTGLPWSEILLLAGAVVFSGTLFALALGAPRWVGAVTPLGGLGMILGFVIFAWSALRG